MKSPQASRPIVHRAVLIGLCFTVIALLCSTPSHHLHAGRRPAPQQGTTPNLESRLRSHVDALAAAGGSASRVVFTAGNRWAVDYILREMRRSRAQVYADTFRVRRRSTGAEYPLANPVAVVPGRSDSVLVICAHLDASASRDAGWARNWATCRAPGADDNATGIAAMLEVLSLVDHAGGKPNYTLMFVGCNAEERNPDYAGLSHRDGHHLGSRRLVSRLRERGTKLKGAIVMDMVGWNPRGDYMPLFSTPRSAWLARDLVMLRDQLGLSLDLCERCGPCSRSDNESFDRMGLPAVLLMESCAPWRSEARHPRNPGYHSSRDTPSMVTYSLLTKVTRLVAAYALKKV